MTTWERSLHTQLIAQHIFAERPRPLTYHDDMKRYDISPRKRRPATYATQNLALMALAITCAVTAIAVTASRVL